jgi:hypothetical protein
VARSKAKMAPMASSDVDAKKAVPFCNDPMIWPSSMRMSRSSM